MWDIALGSGGRLGKGPKKLSREGSFSSQCVSPSQMCGQLCPAPGPPQGTRKVNRASAAAREAAAGVTHLELARVSQVSEPQSDACQLGTEIQG